MNPEPEGKAGRVTDDFDVIVIGAGPTGENVADYATKGGLNVAIVESELVGGECSYWACMPSKALLRPPAALEGAASVDGAEQAVTGGLDVDRVLARRDSFASDWNDQGQVDWLKGAGIELVRGDARLSGERHVTVTSGSGERTLTAQQAVVVATGSVPVVPPIDGLAGVSPWTSREATAAKRAPARLAVVGGGVVGCEMAAAWAALGSRVTLLAKDPLLLPRMEPFAGEAVREGLVAAGVTVRSDVAVTSAKRDDFGVTLLTDHGPSVTADEVLVATGRRPNTSGIGLDTVGLEPGQALNTDETGRVTGVAGDWLYAAGDVTGRAPLTHMGKYAARACGRAIAARAVGRTPDSAPWGAEATTAERSAITQVVFTRPEVASVGLTEREARQLPQPTRTVEYEIGSIAGAALFADGYSGRAKLVIDSGRKVVLGAAFTGAEVGELLHAATIAVVGEVPLDRLWHAVPAYPTISEIWLRLLEALLADGAF
ncbi:MAG: pyridine nucleotide-disulfide oxidoreductase [Streptosporangiales bacterium]|nr:pyridine nucleotide-disulfide oxidoreductase [Streptosporangiales bacterium]